MYQQLKKSREEILCESMGSFGTSKKVLNTSFGMTCSYKV